MLSLCTWPAQSGWLNCIRLLNPKRDMILTRIGLDAEPHHDSIDRIDRLHQLLWSTLWTELWIGAIAISSAF